MVQAQVEREQNRKKMSREEFLATLQVTMQLYQIPDAEHPKFQRAFELLNKTNQFNTNGKRWTLEEIGAAMKSGTRLFAFEVEDKYTRYGLVGVIIEERGDFKQFVMSCRTVGLDVELAAIFELIAALSADGIKELRAVNVDTPSNLLSRDIWQKCGFSLNAEGVWRRSSDDPPAVPAHIAMTGLRQGQIAATAAE